MSDTPTSRTTSSAHVSGGERHGIPVEIPGRTTKERAAGEWGRSILATAEASVEHGSFGAAWRDYVASTEFNKLPEHDRALIRVAFVSGWGARGDAP